MDDEMPRSPKTECYCMSLKNTSNALSSLYDDALKPAGLTTRQFSLLHAIARADDPSVSELARLSYLKRSTLTRLLKPLIARGLIIDKKKPGARNSMLNITESGMNVLDIANPLWLNAQKQVEDLIGDADLEVLLGISARIRDAVLSIRDDLTP